MASIGLEDALRPTNASFKAFYGRSYRTRYRVWAAAANDCSLPSTCLEWEQLFPQHAFLPVGVDLEGNVFVTGKSAWSSDGTCDLPMVEQTVRFPFTTSSPIPIILADNPAVSLSRWFGINDRYVLVLTFAWAYALSARWAEIVPQTSSMQYTTSKARWDAHMRFGTPSENDKHIFVNLGALNNDETRWWEAVLALGEGWKATIPYQKWLVLSPWSVNKECSGIKILLAGSPSHSEQASQKPVSFEEALGYIERYCALHNADVQNRAALAAALLLPQVSAENRKIHLHAPKGLGRKPLESRAPRRPPFGDDSLHQFDKLLTLSANGYGMKAVLGSIFYASGVPANICEGLF